MPETQEPAAAVAAADKPMIEALAGIERALRDLAVVQAARLLYDRQALGKQIAQLQELYDADFDAFKAIGKANLESSGVSAGDVADAPRTASAKAREANKAANEAVLAFESLHPLIKALLNQASPRYARFMPER